LYYYQKLFALEILSRIMLVSMTSLYIGLYRASILFAHEAGASALGLAGSLEKAGSCPKKILTLCSLFTRT
jgi:hypothetical protein